MPSRLSYLVVALGNAPRHPLRRGISLTLLLGWVVGVVLLPAPEDRLVLWLSRLAVACSLVACVGVFLLANRGVEPTCFPGRLLRKVLASAKADNAQVPDALMLFRVWRAKDDAPDTAELALAAKEGFSWEIVVL